MKGLLVAYSRMDDGQSGCAGQELLPLHRRQSLNALTSQNYAEATFLDSLEIVREAVFL